MGLDTAIAHWNCDPARVGFVGLNLGGSIGAYWLAKGAPVKAAVLTGAIPNLTDFWLHSEHPAAEAARSQGSVDLAAYEARMRETDLLETLPKFKGVNTLLQFGSEDPWVSENAREKATALAGTLPNVAVALTEDDHEMRRPVSVRGRVAFFEKAFGLDPVR